MTRTPVAAVYGKTVTDMDCGSVYRLWIICYRTGFHYLPLFSIDSYEQADQSLDDSHDLDVMLC